MTHANIITAMLTIASNVNKTQNSEHPLLHTSMYLHICTHTCMYLCIHTCKYMYICLCAHTCTYCSMIMDSMFEKVDRSIDHRKLSHGPCSCLMARASSGQKCLWVTIATRTCCCAIWIGRREREREKTILLHAIRRDVEKALQINLMEAGYCEKENKNDA